MVSGTLADFVRHNETTPSFGESLKYREIAQRVGMDYKGALMGSMKCADNADARYAARNTARALDRALGSHKGMMLTWGDEYRLHVLRAIRDMVGIYHDEGFTFAVNSQSGYVGGARNGKQSLGCDEQLFRRIVKTVFTMRRKMMRNGMKQILGKDSPMLADPLFTKRPEQLSVQDYIDLTNRVEAELNRQA